MFRSNSSAEYIARASKVVTLVDLAGHERYFKTTAYGLTGHMPDYACLIVGANAGDLLQTFNSAYRITPADGMELKLVYREVWGQWITTSVQCMNVAVRPAVEVCRPYSTYIA